MGRLFFRIALWVLALVVFASAVERTQAGYSALGSHLWIRTLVTLGPVVLLTVALLYLAVFVHELGHVVAGLAVGFQLHAFAVGPVGFRRTPTGTRWFVPPMLTMGYTVMSPDRPERVLPRFAWFVAGGPIASIIYCGVVYAVWRIGMVQPNPSLVMGLTSWLVMSLAVLPGTLIPYRGRSGLPTDALWLYYLLRNEAFGTRLTALVFITRSLMLERRPRDWPKDVVDNLEEPQDGSEMELRALIIKATALSDRKENEALAQVVRRLEWLVDRHQKRSGDTHWQLAVLIATFQAAWFEADAERAAAWRARLPNLHASMSASAAICDAVIAYARGELNESENLVARARAELRSLHARYGGNHDPNLEFLDELQGRIRALRDEALK